jgi:hypothetical protein
MLPPELAEAVRAGKWDHLTGMQVLARHREAAEQRGPLEGAEIMREAALRALQTAQYDPAPYTKVKAAISALDPAAILAQHDRSKAMDELIAGDGE